LLSDRPGVEGEISMRDLFLSPPWWLAAVVVIVGAVVFYSGNARRQNRVRLAGVIVALLGVVMFLVGFFVETDKQKVSRLTRELVQAVPAKDWPKMTALLDPDASLFVYSNRQELVDGAKANVERWDVRSVTITSLTAKPDQTGFIVDAEVLVDAPNAVYKSPTGWRFYWDKTGDDWHVHQIEPLSSAGMSASEINQAIRK
jgi:hypothetical protein